jgi:hypothetical protein
MGERGERSYQVGESGIFPIEIHGGLCLIWKSLEGEVFERAWGLEMGSRDGV